MPLLGTAFRAARTSALRTSLHSQAVEPQAAPSPLGDACSRAESSADRNAESSGTLAEPLALWHPLVAALLSLVFTPVFGALLHGLNALELGERHLRRVAWMWLALALAFTASGLYLVALDRWHAGSGFSASALLSGYTMVWYAFAGRQQSRLIGRLGSKLWRPRSFVLPLALALLCMAVPGLLVWWQGRG
ncbi:MAG: hypothetical protein RIQ60_4364 [Pseudomonadota bacterium]|jgi:uncharacterized membrane protein